MTAKFVAPLVREISRHLIMYVTLCYAIFCSVVLYYIMSCWHFEYMHYYTYFTSHTVSYCRVHHPHVSWIAVYNVMKRKLDQYSLPLLGEQEDGPGYSQKSSEIVAVLPEFLLTILVRILRVIARLKFIFIAGLNCCLVALFLLLGYISTSIYASLKFCDYNTVIIIYRSILF